MRKRSSLAAWLKMAQDLGMHHHETSLKDREMRMAAEKKARALMRTSTASSGKLHQERELSRLEASMMSDQLHAESIHAEATRIASEHIDEDLSVGGKRRHGKVALAQELKEKCRLQSRADRDRVTAASKPCGSDMRNLLL